jgi:hypothetical protein
VGGPGVGDACGLDGDGAGAVGLGVGVGVGEADIESGGDGSGETTELGDGAAQPDARTTIARQAARRPRDITRLRAAGQTIAVIAAPHQCHSDPLAR